MRAPASIALVCVHGIAVDTERDSHRRQ